MNNVTLLIETCARAGSLALIWGGLTALFGDADPITVGIYSFGACAFGFWAGKRNW